MIISILFFYVLEWHEGTSQLGARMTMLSREKKKKKSRLVKPKVIYNTITDAPTTMASNAARPDCCNILAAPDPALPEGVLDVVAVLLLLPSAEEVVELMHAEEFQPVALVTRITSVH